MTDSAPGTVRHALEVYWQDEELACSCGWKPKPFDPLNHVEPDAQFTAHLAEVEHGLQATFDLRWKADMRAIKAWQEAHPGSENVWPDHVDLVLWLVEQSKTLLWHQMIRNHDQSPGGCSACADATAFLKALGWVEDQHT